MNFQAESDLGLLILFAHLLYKNDLDFCQTSFSNFHTVGLYFYSEVGDFP